MRQTENTSPELSQVSEDDVDSSEDSEAPASSVVYHVGDRVDGFYQAFRGPRKFFPGHITAVHSDGTYDIEYDDGDKETRVAAGFIRYYEDEGEEEDNRVVTEGHVKSSVSDHVEIDEEDVSDSEVVDSSQSCEDDTSVSEDIDDDESDAVSLVPMSHSDELEFARMVRLYSTYKIHDICHLICIIHMRV